MAGIQVYHLSKLEKLQRPVLTNSLLVVVVVVVVVRLSSCSALGNGYMIAYTWLLVNSSLHSICFTISYHTVMSILTIFRSLSNGVSFRSFFILSVGHDHDDASDRTLP